MSQGFEIQVFNRCENKINLEKVYGDGAVKFAYGNPIGRLYGKSQDSLKSGGTEPSKLREALSSVEISLTTNG